jgi:short-subunit dehydrogenase
MSAVDFRALVTGASSGIGAAFARALRARGERLILVARRADRLVALAKALGGEAEVATIPLDLTDPDAGARLQEEVERQRLVVDLLVNNAGAGDSGLFHEEPLDRMLGMVDLNAKALLELTRRFVPGMIERKRGRIINVVSTSAFQPVPFLSVYAATKAFALSLTEALATELAGTGVRVQALCPGLTATEFHEVAHTENVWFNKTGAMSPDQVVATSLKALDRGRLRVIPGFPNRLLIAAQRFAPQSLIRRVGAELFRPRPQKVSS